jgi:hypothetical protein
MAGPGVDGEEAMKWSLLLVLCVACAKAEKVPQAVPDTTPVWQATLVPCTPTTCGDVGQNYGSMSLESGEVAVGPDGLVAIKLRGFIDSNGARGADRTLEVWNGRFVPTGFEGVGIINPMGTITTDGHGDFDGTILTRSGDPFHFVSGAPVKGQFILNQPGVRSLFVTASSDAR